MMVLFRMPTFAHFELIEPVSEDVANTWLAREPGSGRLLLLHKFSRASGLREKIRTMNPPDLGMLIKAGEESGLFYVVTYDTPELRQFRHWVESRSKVKAASTYPPGVEHSDPAKTGLWRPTATPSSEPGTFTRMFEAQPPAPSAVEPSPKPAPSGPGEFTRMFQTPPPAGPEPPAGPKQDAEHTRTIEIPAWIEPVAPEPAAPEESASTTGEFTRTFQPPPVTRPDFPAAPNAPSGNAQPGEFTRMFQAPAAPVASTRPAAPAARTREVPAQQSAESVPPKPGAPGEFTRMFAAPREPAPQAHPEPVHPEPARPQPQNPGPPGGTEPGTFTRMFQAPPPDPAPVEPRPPAPPAKGPGEFTQMFRTPPAAPVTSRPMPSAPQPSAPGGDFTEYFGRSFPSTPLGDNLDRTPSTPPEPAPRDPGSFTRMFGGADSLRGQVPAQPAPPPPATGLFHSPQPPAPPTAAPSGSGEYTRLFAAPALAPNSTIQAPAAASAPPVSAPSPSTPEPKRPAPAAIPQTPSNYIWLVVFLAVLAVLAIGLILYFALRR